MFTRHVFDAKLAAVHDVIVGDLNNDNQPDVLTMSDKNDLRWYHIPDVPNGRWRRQTIGRVRSFGYRVPGDIDGDNDLDVVRSNVWFENKDDGKNWTMHRMSEPSGADQSSFAVNATQTETVDLNRDGRLDVIICDGENPSSKIAWLEAPKDPGAASGQRIIYHAATTSRVELCIR